MQRDTGLPPRYDERRERTHSLSGALRQAFPITGPSDVHVHFYHTNDKGREEAWSETRTLLQEKPPSSDLVRIVTMVGSSGWQSFLPDLVDFTDILLLWDIDKDNGRWNTYAANAFRQSPTPTQYEDRVYGSQNTLWVKELKDSPLAEYNRDIEFASLGQWHFLLSPERYTLCHNSYLRAISNGMEVLPIHLDLSDPDSIATFNAVVQGKGEIVLGDFTNVYIAIAYRMSQINPNLPTDFVERVATYFGNLRSLPFADGALLSATDGVTNGKGVSRGVEEFIAKYQRSGTTV